MSGHSCFGQTAGSILDGDARWNREPQSGQLAVRPAETSIAMARWPAPAGPLQWTSGASTRVTSEVAMIVDDGSFGHALP